MSSKKVSSNDFIVLISEKKDHSIDFQHLGQKNYFSISKHLLKITFFSVVCLKIFQFDIINCYRPNRLLVYNCTSGANNPILWKQIETWGQEFIRKHPFSDILWYPGGSFKRSKLINNLCIYAFHLTPAFIIDTLSLLSGRKPM